MPIQCLTSDATRVTSRKELFEVAASTSDPIPVSSELYHDSMEILPPVSLGPDWFVMGEGDDELVYYSKFAASYSAKYLRYASKYQNLYFTLCRNIGQEEFTVYDLFSSNTGELLEAPEETFPHANAFIEWLRQNYKDS